MCQLFKVRSLQKISLSSDWIFLILAEESGYEDEGPRRQKPAEKVKRVSQSKLDVISETLSSKCSMHDNDFFGMITQT